MAAHIHTGERTFSIPDHNVNPRAFTIPHPIEETRVAADATTNDPTRQQLEAYILSLERIHNRENVVVQTQRRPLVHDSTNKREEFLMNLYETQKQLPTGSRYSINRRQKAYKPNKAEVARSDIQNGEEVVLGNNYQNLYPGDHWGDRNRQLANHISNVPDGRVTSDNVVLGGFATGATVVPRQSVYQAVRSRGDAFVKRDVDALKARRNINVQPGRTMAVSYQGPNAITHDAGTNTRHGKRMGGTGETYRNVAPKATFFHQPYTRPEHVKTRPKQSTIVPGRTNVWQQFKVERPQIGDFVEPMQRPRTFEQRTPNISDVTTYGQEGTVVRANAFETTNFPNFINPEQPTRWVVPGNRAPGVRNIKFDYTEDRSLDTGDYTRKHAAKNNELNEDQRNFIFTQQLTKASPVKQPAPLLTHRDPLLPPARHQDMYVL